MIRLNVLRNCCSLSNSVSSFSSKPVINKALSSTQATIDPIESTSESNTSNKSDRPTDISKTETSAETKIRTYYEYAQLELKSTSLEEFFKSSISKPLPKFFQNLVMKWGNRNQSILGGNPLSEQEISALDRAGIKLQGDCANNYKYLELIEAFGLPDDFISWFKLSMLHSWMILVRLSNSLEAEAFIRLRYIVLKAFWIDVDKRAVKLRLEIKSKEKLDEGLKKLTFYYYQTLYEWEEGLLSDDTVLAAAFWRSFYHGADFDAVHLSALVRYVRGTMAWLNTLDTNAILMREVVWKPTKEFV